MKRSYGSYGGYGTKSETVTLAPIDSSTSDDVDLAPPLCICEKRSHAH